jgi:hypothetical protein
MAVLKAGVKRLSEKPSTPVDEAPVSFEPLYSF